MTYREPAPRQPRLWWVVIGWTIETTTLITRRIRGEWIWALEGDEAVNLTIDKYKADRDGGRVWFHEAVCGEDFAEREAEGPPAPKAAT